MEALKNLIPSVLLNLQKPAMQSRSRLVSGWETIVGEKIAAHTKPTLSEQKELCVWVDQPVLAYELSQKHKSSILKRTQALLGEDAVRTVRFRVGQLR